MKQLKDFRIHTFCHGGCFCDRPALRNILLTAKNHQCKYSLHPRLRPQLYRQFLPYRLLYVRQKAVMEQSVRFRRGAFIQLTVAHRTAEHLPVAGTFQSHRSYSGIRHSHSGQFIGALRFQTKRLMYSNDVFLATLFKASKYNTFAKHLSYTFVK